MHIAYAIFILGQISDSQAWLIKQIYFKNWFPICIKKLKIIRQMNAVIKRVVQFDDLFLQNRNVKITRQIDLISHFLAIWRFFKAKS